MKRVELHPYQKAKSGYENGYCMRHGYLSKGVESGGGYKVLVAKAKRYSEQFGKERLRNWDFKETEELEKGLAFVGIMTTIGSKDESIEIIDVFKNGEYAYTLQDNWYIGGHCSKKYVRTGPLIPHTFESVTIESSK